MERVFLTPMDAFGSLGVTARDGVVTLGFLPEVGPVQWVELTPGWADYLAGLLRSRSSGVAGRGFRFNDREPVEAVDVGFTVSGECVVTLVMPHGSVRGVIEAGLVGRFGDAVSAAALFASDVSHPAWDDVEEGAAMVAAAARELGLPMFYPLEVVADRLVTAGVAATAGDAG